MKYPRLKDTQDLRRKLMDTDIADIQTAYRIRPDGISDHGWYGQMASIYGVDRNTIKYYCDMDYQAKMKAKNANAHSKADMDDYIAHRDAEVKRRVGRWNRNPSLRQYHYIVSAKNEKRLKRKTVLGDKINDLQEKGV